MNKTFFYIILASSFALSACAGNTPAPEAKVAAANADTSAAESKRAAAEKSEKQICKRMTRTGSRMAQRVCGTQEQWDRAAHQSAGALGSDATRRTAQGTYRE
ncbi:hypothetical protein FKG94_16465 [Exilibacterium tricleocarpae]|uniref:Lipoprotein n=1 Tax=Exilibacterium tricleocarpae TaxID=2591008 RepID=A0A545TAG1_9GAMM|nr:hypothetical protein [Exilibacterium tricleocarpae]TQV74200.1 hypothetical protein FKG94_16465 [Exilibacterium tricleocarpae]